MIKRKYRKKLTNKNYKSRKMRERGWGDKKGGKFYLSLKMITNNMEFISSNAQILNAKTTWCYIKIIA